MSLDSLKCRLDASKLPAADPLILYKLKTLYKKHQVILVNAETGAGKGVAIAPYVMILENTKKEQILEVKKVAVSEPRSLNTHVADYLQKLYGPIIGRAYRGENFTGPHTRLDFLTDGFLVNKLDDYEVIIIDEVHERNKNIDILLAMCKKNNIKTILLSATMDVNFFLKYFETPGYLEIPGRTFPIEDVYLEKTDDFVAQAAELANTIDQDVLIFLSSAAELRKACKLIMKPCYELHKGNLQNLDNFFEQNTTTPKVIFSTNVAESGVTMNISVVIDSGRAYKNHFNAEQEIQELDTVFISRAEAMQRRGRAGRISAGICYHLYSKSDFDNFNEYKSPEIPEIDITEFLLDLYNATFLTNNLEQVREVRNTNSKKCVKDLDLLNFLPSPPSAAQIEFALKNLHTLDLIELNPKLIELNPNSIELNPNLIELNPNSIELNPNSSLSSHKGKEVQTSSEKYINVTDFQITEKGRKIASANLSVNEAITLFESDKLGVSDAVCKILAMRSVEPDLNKWCPAAATNSNVPKWPVSTGDIFAFESILSSYMNAAQKNKTNDWFKKYMIMGKIEAARKNYQKLKYIVSQFRENNSSVENSNARVKQAFQVGFVQNVAYFDNKTNTYKVNRKCKTAAASVSKIVKNFKPGKKILYLDIVAVNGKISLSNILNL